MSRPRSPARAEVVGSLLRPAGLRQAIDAYYERGLNPWDHAAGALIAREAGAQVAGVRGGPASSELIVAAAPDLYAELAAVLKAAGLDA